MAAGARVPGRRGAALLQEHPRRFSKEANRARAGPAPGRTHSGGRGQGRRSFGHKALRAALVSSPLWGAGRVEDTYNLLGHALRKALGVVARQQGRGLADVAAEAGAPILGGTSLKAALDLDWDDPVERTQALVVVLDAL